MILNLPDPNDEEQHNVESAVDYMQFVQILTEGAGQGVWEGMRPKVWDSMRGYAYASCTLPTRDWLLAGCPRVMLVHGTNHEASSQCLACSFSLLSSVSARKLYRPV